MELGSQPESPTQGSSTGDDKVSVKDSEIPKHPLGLDDQGLPAHEPTAKRQRLEEGTAELEKLRLGNDHLLIENEELKRKLEHLQCKYEERGEMINRLLDRQNK